jgi:hypothetical protein
VKPTLLHNSQNLRALSGSGAVTRDGIFLEHDNSFFVHAADGIDGDHHVDERAGMRASDQTYTCESGGDALNGLGYARFAQTSPVYMYKRTDKNGAESSHGPLNIRSNITIHNINDEADSQSSHEEGSESASEVRRRVHVES